MKGRRSTHRSKKKFILSQKKEAPNRSDETKKIMLRTFFVSLGYTKSCIVAEHNRCTFHQKENPCHTTCHTKKNPCHTTVALK